MSEAAETQADDTAAHLVDISIDKVRGEVAAFNAIEAGLKTLNEKHPANLVVDVTTPAGMREAVAARAAWRDPRVSLEKARKAAKAPVLALGKQIDNYAADIEARLRIGEDNYHEQIRVEVERKEAEKAAAAEAERVRVQALRDDIALRFSSRPARLFGQPAAKLDEAIQAMEAQQVDEMTYADLAPEAEAAQTAALAMLREMHAKAVASEEEAERQRIQAEENARAAQKLADERAAFERQQAQAREEQEDLERELKYRREKAEQEQREREAAAQAKVEAERQARAAELEAIEQAKAALAAAQRAEEDRKAAAERERQDAEAAEARRIADEKARVERETRERDAREQEAAQRAAVDAAQAKAMRAARKLAKAQQCGPRLLAALRDLADSCEQMEAGTMDAAMRTNYDEARAAIAEAEAE